MYYDNFYQDEREEDEEEEDEFLPYMDIQVKTRWGFHVNLNKATTITFMFRQTT